MVDPQSSSFPVYNLNQILLLDILSLIQNLSDASNCGKTAVIITALL